MEQATTSSDDDLVLRLRAGDETAFRMLVEQYDAPLRRVARSYVATDAAADEVVQDTWVGVVRGIDRFEMRSSLKTWIYRILLNIARTRGVRDKRSIPFASLAGEDDDGPAFAAERFQTGADPYPGHWAAFPTRWHDQPEIRAVGHETLEIVRRALEMLPASQQDVVRLRDVEGWSSSEVCNALDLTETNQRVLLHRGRAKLRAALESYFEESMRGMSTVKEMACQELVERVTDYLDAALSPVDRERFDVHIGECPGCDEVLAQFRSVIAVTGRLSSDDVESVDPRTRDALLGVFRSWHNERR